MEAIKDLLKDRKEFTKQMVERHKYVSQEFQDYGYRLALKLDDLGRVSMYIRLAKMRERAFLDTALSFAIDYPNAKNKGRLFLWKLKQLEDERKKTLGIVDVPKKKRKTSVKAKVEKTKSPKTKPKK